MHRARLAIIFLVLISGLGLRREPESFQGKCVGVSDGDTITVLKASRPVKIRVEGIDCPELHQDFGNRARQFTAALVFGKSVVVVGLYNDRYGRLVARVSVDHKDLSLQLIEAGLAWHYRAHSSDKVLAAAEGRARAARRGLWSMKNPVPPWEWRRERPGLRTENPALRTRVGKNPEK